MSFYDRDADIVADVARFLADGLAQGDRVVVVATAEHRQALEDVLLQYGADAVRARVSGRYLAFDAAEMLGRVMRNGRPDDARFRTAVGSVVDAAGEDGCRVRVFGEMVTLLWDTGDVAGAIELETIWNRLSATHDFSLLCAYPTDAHNMCEAHSQVLAPRSYASAAYEAGPAASAVRTSDVFVPVAGAVPAARRFVAATLRAWGEQPLLADAALVTSELATNAVQHAGSPFRISVRRSATAVRIAIEDAGPAQPELRTSEPEEFGGRGVAIVAKIARTWGCDTADDGKVVWAELAPDQSA